MREREREREREKPHVFFCLGYLTLQRQPLLRVFEIRVLRRIFGPKRDEVTGVEKTT
jgi:hypothetical protein